MQVGLYSDFHIVDSNCLLHVDTHGANTRMLLTVVVYCMSTRMELTQLCLSFHREIGYVEQKCYLLKSVTAEMMEVDSVQALSTEDDGGAS